jgi:hypothetical protein
MSPKGAIFGRFAAVDRIAASSPEGGLAVVGIDFATADARETTASDGSESVPSGSTACHRDRSLALAAALLAAKWPLASFPSASGV